jgi:hypothetical protein
LLRMEREKVRLSRQGADYLKNPNCSTIVRAVLRSIDAYTAEILYVNDSIVRVKLSDICLPEEFTEHNDFAVHKDHLVIV